MNTERTPYDDEEREVSQMEDPTPMFHAPAMTNHEKVIILRWLIDERERLMGDYIRLRDEGNGAEAYDVFRERVFLSEQYDRVAALDTSAPALTDDERKAQAAGIMGKMSRNGVA